MDDRQTSRSWGLTESSLSATLLPGILFRSFGLSFLGRGYPFAHAKTGARADAWRASQKVQKGGVIMTIGPDVIFVGPSMPIEEARLILPDAIYLPPQAWEMFWGRRIITVHTPSA